MKKRPLLTYILFFILGVCFCKYDYGIAVVAILFVLCEIYCYLSKTIKKDKKINLSYFLIFLFFLCSFIGLEFGICFNQAKILEVKEYDNSQIKIYGTINNDGVKKGAYWQYVLKDNFINGKKINSNILIKTKSKLEYGNFIKAYAQAELPKKSSNDKLFSYSEYLKTIRIYLILKSDNVEILQKNKLNIIENISSCIRNKVREFTTSTLEEVEGGILDALIIGDGSRIDEDLEVSYKKAGMLHLLVVSGGHTVFLVVLLRFLLSFLGISKNLSKIIYIMVMIVYIFITGATASILRAGIGFIIVMFANIIGRENDAYTTIGLVAFILILNNPNILFSLSFLLSFGGVLGIIICYPKISEYLAKIPKIIAEPLSLTIAAQLFVTPITMYSFNTMYLGGIISNIFTLNLSGIIMMAGIVLFIIYFFIPPLVIFPMRILAYFIFIMNKIAEFFGDMEWLTKYVVTPSWLSIILYYILLVYIFLGKKSVETEKGMSLVIRKNRIVRFLSSKRKIIAAIFIILIVFFYNLEFIKLNKTLNINVIDVGHGDSILITTPKNKHILIDTGDSYYQDNKTFDNGEKIIVPYLLKHGIKNIDLLVLTHMDSDHIGGFNSISKAINIDTLALSINSDGKEKCNDIKRIAMDNFITIKTLKRGDSFVIDDIEFEVLMPQKSKEIQNENNDSIVLLMKYQGEKALFMGDLEKEGEEYLLNLESDLDIDILKLGHHGSNTSSSENFIKATTPKIALISVGNRFKSIPGKDVLKRLSSVYSSVYRTDKDGEINISINNGNIFVKTIY